MDKVKKIGIKIVFIAQSSVHFWIELWETIQYYTIDRWLDMLMENPVQVSKQSKKITVTENRSIE